MYNIGLHHLTGPSSTVAVVAVESRSSATAKKKGGKVHRSQIRYLRSKPKYVRKTCVFFGNEN